MCGTPTHGAMCGTPTHSAMCGTPTHGTMNPRHIMTIMYTTGV